MLRVAISAGLLAVLLYHLDLARTGRLLGRANRLLVAAMFLMLVLQVVFSAYKLMVLVRCRAPGITLPRMIRIVLISLFLGEFVPGTVGTEIARMYGVARVTSDSALSFTAVLMDRILGLAGLITVVLVGLLTDRHGVLQPLKYWAPGALALIVGGWLAVMSPAFRSAVNRLLRPERLRLLHRKVEKVYACMDAFRRRPLVLGWAYLLAIGYNVLRATTIFVGARALGVHVSLSAFLIIIPVTILLVQLPMTIGGFGVREVVYVSLLKTYGVPGEAALAISFLQILTGLCAELLPGAVLFMFSKSASRPAGNAPTPSTNQRRLPAGRGAGPG